MATRDRAPSSGECWQWRTYTDNDSKKKKKKKGGMGRKHREKIQGEGEERHDSLAATQPGEWSQEKWHGISVQISN